MLYTLQNKNQKLTIDSFGSQILSWSTNNSPIFYISENPKRSGMPIMFPFCGPLKDGVFINSGHKIAQHGFARSVEWNFLDQEGNSKIRFILKSDSLDPSLRLAYPYDFQVIFEVELSDFGVKTSLVTTNFGEHKMPICPGFHPYFFVPQRQKQQLQIYSQQDSNFYFNAKLLPWETGVEAQFYPNPEIFEITLPSGKKIKVSDTSHIVNSNTEMISKKCELLTVWAGEVADFVCIEPMTRPFNSINVDPILLGKNQEFALVYDFSLDFYKLNLAG